MATLNRPQHIAPDNARMTDEQTEEHRARCIAMGLIIPKAEDVPSSSKPTTDAKGAR